MLNRILVRCSLLLTFALVLGAAPALAQERGKSAEHEKGKAAAQRRPELQRRGEDDDREDREERARQDAARARAGTANRAATGRRAGVPPGWCQGTNNPHNTVANCGTTGTRGIGNGSAASYEAAHAAYHRELDQRYRELAAQRPLDVQRQLQLRAQKSAEHERWHAESGLDSNGRRREE